MKTFVYQAYPGQCPTGLLWNGLAQECDFPENVNCELSMGAAAKAKVPTGTYIYLTFDDGPNEGTPYVLDALKQVRLLALRGFVSPPLQPNRNLLHHTTQIIQSRNTNRN